MNMTSFLSGLVGLAVGAVVVLVLNLVVYRALTARWGREMKRLRK